MRESSRRSNRILGGAMSPLGPSPAAAGTAGTDAADATASNILAGIRRRKAGGKKRRGIPAAAGVVVLFSALCATLLWVGVGSFSHLPAAGGAGSNSTRGRGSEVCVVITHICTSLRDVECAVHGPVPTYG